MSKSCCEWQIVIRKSTAGCDKDRYDSSMAFMSFVCLFLLQLFDKEISPPSMFSDAAEDTPDAQSVHSQGTATLYSKLYILWQWWSFLWRTFFARNWFFMYMLTLCLNPGGACCQLSIFCNGKAINDSWERASSWGSIHESGEMCTTST